MIASDGTLDPMEAAGCLEDETIAAMLEGTLGSDRAERARAHITRCDACRRLVSAAVDVVAPTLGIAATMGGGALSSYTTSFPIEGGTAALRAGLPIGTVVAGRYRIERVVGEGGMGVVFAARQLGLDRLVALKVLSARLANDGIALARFRREGRLVASLENEHVVRIHDFGALETGEPFLAMELLEGEDLAQIAARGPTPIPDAIAWLRAACDGLGEAHLLGIIHRDIKPSNIFRTRTGKVKVLDFGLAKLCAPVGHTAVTATGIVLGTPGYIAPEQILGARDVDARADVFALGATLYHVVTGQPLFVDTSFELVMRRIVSGTTPSLVGLPPDLAAVVGRCLAREPAARFATAKELSEALGAMASASAPVPVVSAPVRSAPMMSAPSMSAPPPMMVTPPPMASRSAPPPMTSMPAPPPMRPAPSSSGGTIALVIVLVIVAVIALGLGGAGLLVYRLSAVAGGEGGSSSSGAATARFDEGKLRTKLGKLGWKISRTTHEDFPGCKHTDFLIDKPPVSNANVRLLDCDSSGVAASEKGRLERGFASASVKTFGDQVLLVQLPTQAESRTLSAALEAP